MQSRVIAMDMSDPKENYNSPSVTQADGIRVLVIDDHPAIRQAVGDTVVLQNDMYVCANASSAQEGLRIVRAERPDVVITDISLGDAHGLDLVRSIISWCPEMRIVVFSVYDENLYAERALQAGALSYLMKNEPTSSLVAAVRSVYRGDVYLSLPMFSRVLGKVIQQQRHRLGASLDELTERERTVFELLGEGKSMHEIIERLDLNRKTVETYRRRTRQKLDFDTNEELLQYAVQWEYNRANALDFVDGDVEGR